MFAPCSFWVHACSACGSLARILGLKPLAPKSLHILCMATALLLYVATIQQPVIDLLRHIGVASTAQIKPRGDPKLEHQDQS